MNTVKATLELYRDSLSDTWRSLGRSLPAMAFLVLAHLGFFALGGALGGSGHAGGFVLGFIQAGLIGWYIAQLEIAVVARRRLRFSDLKDTFGAYFWETISVLFLFFVPQLILRFTAPQLLLVLVPIAALVFNPAPEALYQDRTQSTQLLGDVMKFMQQNWPEWLAVHAVAAALLGLWGWGLTGVVSPAWWLEVVQIFGPFFRFITAGDLALRLGGIGAAGILSFFGMFLFVHTFMLFRGHLYARLRRSSRRTRAWQARM